jgi:hypothetical protein
MNWKYFIRDSSDAPLENEYFEWAREQFGNINQTRWNANFQGYWFDDEKDVTLFLLRWGDNPNLTGLEIDDQNND